MTQRRILAGSFLAASALLAPSAAQTAATRSISIRATLTGSGEIPALSTKATKASGRLVGTLRQTKTGYQLSWYLTFKGLSGAATFANIERGSARKRGPNVTFLCGPCKSGAHGSFYASPGELLLIQKGGLYVNVRTKKHPGGEIRGRLSQKR
jgi:hypothetical protein